MSGVHVDSLENVLMTNSPLMSNALPEVSMTKTKFL